MLGYIYMQGMPKQKQEPFILVIFGTIMILINKMHHHIRCDSKKMSVTQRLVSQLLDMIAQI